MIDGVHIANAAAELHRHVDRCDDRGDCSIVDRLAGERAVQIDDMNPFEPRRCEIPRLGGRIVVKGRCLVHFAPDQPYACAVFQIDRRKQYHFAGFFLFFGFFAFGSFLSCFE